MSHRKGFYVVTRLVILTLIIAVGSLQSQTARAQFGFGTVTAYVLDRNRQPLVGEVHLYNLSTKEFITATANSDPTTGLATINGVPPGLYHIGAYVDGPYNQWIFSPNFQGWQVSANQTTGPIDVVMEDAPASTAGVFGFVRFDDENGAHPIGSGVSIEFYSGGHRIGTTNSNQNGQYQFNNLRTPASFWGFYTYIARWSGVKAVGVNFGAWPGVPIRMDIPLPSPVSLSDLSLNVMSVAGGNSATGTVTLSGPAPVGGIYAHLQSDNTSVAQVPATVFIPAGQDSATFTVTTTPGADLVTVTLTGSYNGGQATAKLDVFPRLQLVAAATGDQKVSLFWSGVDANIGYTVIGYNVYRATTSGGQTTKLNTTPITTPDNGPGLQNAFMYSDTTGLTNGTEYFYSVVAVKQDGSEGVQSNEDSATPDASAIPWDTENAAQITTQAEAIMFANLMQGEGDPGDLAVVGPNGVVYTDARDGSPAQAISATGSYSSASGRIEYPDNTSSPVLAEAVETSLQPGPYPLNGYSATSPPTGIFRKVEALPGNVGFTGLVGLPDPSNSAACFLNAGDQAYIYTGGYTLATVHGNVREFALDAGLQFATNGNPGWKLYCFAKHGRYRTPIHQRRYWVLPDEDALMILLAPGFGTVPNNLVRLSVHGHLRNIDTGVERVAATIIYFTPGWKRSNSGNLVIKRVNSLAQNIPASRRTFGWNNSGSYVLGAFWGDITGFGETTGLGLVPGGLWTSDITFGRAPSRAARSFAGSSKTNSSGKRELTWIRTTSHTIFWSDSDMRMLEPHIAVAP